MTDKTISDLILLSNLQDIEHLVLLRNDTSGTICLEENTIRILEMKDDSIIITVPANTCAVSHSLTLCILKLPLAKKISKFPKPGQHKNALEVIGKVAKVKKSKNKQEDWTLLISFTQFDVDSWERFIITYVERQNNINNLKKNI